LGPSTVEKTSPAIVKILGGKTSSTTAGGSGAAQTPTHALDLFDSGSSASDSKMANPAPPRKRLRKSPVPKSVLKPFEAPTAKGTLEQFLALCLSKSYDIELFLAFVTVKMVVASVATSVKDFGSGGVRADEQLTSAGSASTQDPLVQDEASLGRGANVLDNALVPRRAGTIDHDAIYGLLTECLQDVSSALVLRTFVICYLVLNSRLFL
jgi:hypothetical protein